MTCAGASRRGSRCSCRASGMRCRRLAAQAGFSTVFLSGYCVSGTLLGLPDVGLLTQTEMADVAGRVCAAAPRRWSWSTPTRATATRSTWCAPSSCGRQAGASGMFLEDQVWPKRCGHMAGKQVVPRDEWLAKLPRRRRPAHAPPRHGPHRRPRRRRPRRGDRAGPDGARHGRRRGVRRGARVDRRARAIAAALPDITLVANMVETGRTPLLTPRRAGRPRLHADRVAARRRCSRWSRRSARARPPAGEGHAARRPRPARDLRRLHRAGRPASGTSRSAAAESSR